jgi:hypothetical protein
MAIIRTFTNRLFWLWVLVAVCSLFAWQTEARADLAGKFIFVRGKVWIIDVAGEKYRAEKGGVVTEGDTIVTEKGGYAQLLMEDKGYMAIRPDTTMRIDTFQYKGKADGTEKGVFSIMKGGFRAITGVIGRKNKKNYKIKTPVANIGIRGTDHEPMFIPVPGPGETPVGQPGAYDKVNVGEAFIENDAGLVTIGKNEVGFAPDATTMPETMAEMPTFYRKSPSPQKAQQEDAETEPPGEESEQETGDEDQEDADSQDQVQEDAAGQPEESTGDVQEEGQEEPPQEPGDPGQEPQDGQSQDPQEDTVQQAPPSDNPDTSEENPPSEDTSDNGQEPGPGPEAPKGPEGPEGPDDASLNGEAPPGGEDQTLAAGEGGVGDDGFTDTIMADAVQSISNGMTIDQPITSQDGTIDLTDPSAVDLPPYRIAGFATWDPRSPLPPHSLVNGMPYHPSEVIVDGSGNVTSFEGEIPVIGGSPDGWDHVSFDINTDYTVTDTGTMALDSGGAVIWGRWHSSLPTPQAIAHYADTGTAVSPTFAPQDIHYIVGPEMTTPVILPVTGTVAYTIVGSTTPTTDQGITGTLNAASLTAHFDQMTVDVAVNVSVPNIQLDTSASGLPINDVSASFTLHEQGPSFGAGALESTPLTVTCSGPGCGTTHNGTVAGGFIGPAGEAVAVGYSLNTTDNSTIDTSVMGVMVFKK